MLVAPIVAAFAVALVGGQLYLRWAARLALDVPNQRSSHTRPTPRGGGLVIVSYLINGGPFGGSSRGVDLFVASLALVVLALVLASVCIATTVIALRVDDLEAWQRHLKEVGADFAAKKQRPDGAWQVFLDDPDGHTIELFTPPPV